MKRLILALFLNTLAACVSPGHHCPCDTDTQVSPLVIMTDFSLKDGAVSAMKGVAYQVNPHLAISDLTHEVPPYDIWQGAYRLSQTYKYWPKGTVFVSVVDPGVGSERRSLAVRSKSGHIFVGPDNGLFTLIDDDSGFEAVTVIDEAKQRLKGSAESNTFHGRDLYVYVGARLAAGQLKLEDAGEAPKTPLVRIPYQKPDFTGGEIHGIIPILDVNYGNVWTNIPKALISQSFPGVRSFQVKIFKGKAKVYEARLPLGDTFAAVGRGKPLLYFNSLLNLAVALNEDDFAKRFKVQSGPDWTIVIGK
jgi:S-adenosylmethionine hydrolase